MSSIALRPTHFIGKDPDQAATIARRALEKVQTSANEQLEMAEAQVEEAHLEAEDAAATASLVPLAQFGTGLLSEFSLELLNQRSRKFRRNDALVSGVGAALSLAGAVFLPNPYLAGSAAGLSQATAGRVVRDLVRRRFAQ